MGRVSEWERERECVCVCVCVCVCERERERERVESKEPVTGQQLVLTFAPFFSASDAQDAVESFKRIACSD